MSMRSILMFFPVLLTGCFFEGFRAPTTDQSLSLSLVGGVSSIKEVTEDTELSFDLVHRPNPRVTFKLVAPPKLGSLTAFDTALGRATYRPNADVSGVSDSLEVKMLLDGDDTAIADQFTVVLKILPVNDAPTLAARTLTVISGQTLAETLVGADPDKDSLSYSVVTGVQHGALTLNAAGQVSYQATAGYSGPDSFEVIVRDAQTTSNPVKISINVQENAALLINRNLVSDCATNPLYNGCVFWKNPVAQRGAPFAVFPSPETDLSALQIQAITIPAGWLDTTGFLRNSTIDVYSDTIANTAARVTAAGGFKAVHANDPARKVAQIHTFYWLMVQARYMKQRVGNFFAENANIRVLASDPTVIDNAYYDSESNQISLGRIAPNFGGADVALGAEVTHHEMGHANVFFATNGAIFFNDDQSTKLCQRVPNGPVNVCCITRDGCSWAANEGLADHHAALLFFNTPVVGEQFENDLNGLSACGVPRNSPANVNLTADQAHNACVNAGAAPLAGEVHVTGSLYAAIWYELKKATPAADAVDIDKLFNEHLKVMTGADTFVTLYNKIRAVDTALFGGKFGPRVQAEFQRRGVI